MKKYQILVTNDDGIDSPGLRAATEAVAGVGDVTIVAPSRQQTGMGRSLTGDKNARLVPVEYRLKGSRIAAYHCDCSPALAVRHSLKTLFNGCPPDMLVSGINYGENLGTNVSCSGTVGAALEAASAGIMAIAISLQTEIESHHSYTEQDWSVASYFLNYFARTVLTEDPLPDVNVLKIDVPDEATVSTPWKLSTLAKTGYYTKVFDSPDVHSRIGDSRTEIKVDPATLDPNSDIYVFAVEKLISVTPLSLDFTSRVDLSQLRESLRF